MKRYHIGVKFNDEGKIECLRIKPCIPHWNPNECVCLQWPQPDRQEKFDEFDIPSGFSIYVIWKGGQIYRIGETKKGVHRNIKGFTGKVRYHSFEELHGSSVDIIHYVSDSLENSHFRKAVEAQLIETYTCLGNGQENENLGLLQKFANSFFLEEDIRGYFERFVDAIKCDIEKPRGTDLEQMYEINLCDPSHASSLRSNMKVDL